MNENLQNQTPKQKKAYDLSNFRVLIVEDFPFISDLMTSALKEMGVSQIFKAENGLRAKDLILNYNAVQSSSNIDVVILDWLMPEMNGQELLKWVRSHKSDSIKFMPVIVCSAYTSQEMIEKVRDLGANEAMVKPVAADKLANRILYVIDKPRSFIKTDTYFGPDRRRREMTFAGEDRRKTNAEEITTHVEELE